MVRMAGKKGIRDDQTGFLLIEVMIAIVIFAIGVMAVCNMLVSGYKGSAVARRYTEASTIGMNKIEELMALPCKTFDPAQLDPDLVDRDNDGGAGDKGLFDATIATADRHVTDPSGLYEIFWNIADNDLAENTKTVSVIVTWGKGGKLRSVSMQRVIPLII